MKFVYFSVILVFISISDYAQNYSEQHNIFDYRNIYEPIVLAIPPKDAGDGLIKLRNGEIRHYAEGISGAEYIYSLDNGINWKEATSLPGEIAADFQSPKSGDFYHLFSGNKDNLGLFCAKASGGKSIFWQISPLATHNLWCRNPCYIPEKSRILFPCSNNKTIIFYTDDEGLNWNHTEWISVPDKQVQGENKSLRWQQLGVEPSLVRLNDGRVWMILRTSHDTFYESFSKDFGETWSIPIPSRFYGTNTMPNFFRMSDGRLLFFWCNSTPLPEFPKPLYMKYYLGYDQINGVWEDVFTNRDVLHVAISDNEGKTWAGFRELYLADKRNASNYGSLGSGNDKSVHQSQCVELGDGKILVACGQNSNFRVLVALDVRWIYEKSRKEDFSSGIDNLCVFQYISGKVGHCSLNRKIGANIIIDTEDRNNKVLKICNPMDSSLVIENQGATWNFPSGKKGEVSFDLYLTDEFKGGNISLIDRWFNPVDTSAYKNAMYSLDISANAYLAERIKLNRNEWYHIKTSWDISSKCEELSNCFIFINGQRQKINIPLRRETINGISYLHFQSRAKEKDTGGFYVDNLSAVIE